MRKLCQRPIERRLRAGDPRSRPSGASDNDAGCRPAPRDRVGTQFFDSREE